MSKNVTSTSKKAVSFDYLSGNEEGSSKFKAFDPLYGTHENLFRFQ
jgi:hypothetical protein